MKKIILLAIFLMIVGPLTYVSVKYYSFVFAKTVKGEVMRVERVNTADAILGSKNIPNAQLFSFSIAIRDEKGQIHTASTEDRQWAVVSAGQCAEARFFPYPPWQLEKGSTYFGARLEKLYDCKKPL